MHTLTRQRRRESIVITTRETGRSSRAADARVEGAIHAASRSYADVFNCWLDGFLPVVAGHGFLFVWSVVSRLVGGASHVQRICTRRREATAELIRSRAELHGVGSNSVDAVEF